MRMQEQPQNSCPERARARPEGGAVIVEEPLIFKIGPDELVTMRTPGHDLELARGFLVSERIIFKLEDIRSMSAQRRDDVDLLEIELSDGQRARAGRLTRVHEIRASCGLCGAPSVDRIAADLPPLRPGFPQITTAQAAAAADDMSTAQELFQQTGGAHAAALYRGSERLLLREDVGRHNAVDKVIGAALKERIDVSDCALVLSGRSGFELVMKALRLGIPIIISISAPTSFAVELAEEAGATLLSFARRGTAAAFADDGRIV